VHHVGILYDQFMMHGQRNIKLSADVSKHRSRWPWHQYVGRILTTNMNVPLLISAKEE